MTIGEQLISNFPNTVKKDDVIFSSLLANTNKTGAIETVLTDAEKFCKEYSGNNNIYDQEGALLTQTINFFSYIEQNSSESDESVKNRISSIFKRNGDTVWGTPNNLKSVFKQYFPSATVYMCENAFPIDESLLDNGDFQFLDGWDISDESIWSKEARFINSYGLDLKAATDFASQDVTLKVTSSNYKVKLNDTYTSIAKNQYGNESLADYIADYDDNPEELVENDIIKIPARNTMFLHFFSKGELNIIIKDKENNKYWDNTNKTWKTSVVKNKFKSKDWSNNNLWFIADNTQSEINVKVEGVSNAYFDYVRLFYKPNYPLFTIMVYFASASVEGALALADGGADTGPIINIGGGATEPPKYGNYGYFDNIYLTGNETGFAQELYEDLLGYIHSSGVKPFLEITSRTV